MIKIVIALSTLGLVSAVPIIVKDFHPSPRLSNLISHFAAVRPVSQLHTLAIPKTYLATVPKAYVAPVIASKPVITHSIPSYIPAIVAKKAETFDPNPGYSYSYSVDDPSTGDSKMAEESLVNGVVRGSYSLAEPDGTIRKVTYTADDVHGFRAKVEKIGTPVHPATSAFKRPIVASTYLSPVPHNYRHRHYYHG